MAFELPNADFAGQLGSGGRVTLQGEGTVQGLSVTAPHAGERDFLQGDGEREGCGVQSLAVISRDQERPNSNNDGGDDDDCTRHNCLSDLVESL